LKIVVFGDVMGRPGRRAVEAVLPRIVELEKPDFFVLNGENIAGGFGITTKIYNEVIDQMNFDVITSGNHWADKADAHQLKDKRLVIPANAENVKNEDDGLKIITARNGEKVAVINLIGRVFMHGQNRDPFKAASRLLALVPDFVKIRLLDIHAETGSEKLGMAYFLKTKVSLVYGTHSHIQTADERIFPWNSGYITDVGATGGYDSILGMEVEPALHRMLNGQKAHLNPAKEDPWACFLVANIDSVTGACVWLKRYRIEIQSQKAFLSVQGHGDDVIKGSSECFFGSGT
jgi:2',3'-cyclic-nucleotide 2'-phosphodiesterase